jgi:hypothetical protein
MRKNNYGKYLMLVSALLCINACTADGNRYDMSAVHQSPTRLLFDVQSIHVLDIGSPGLIDPENIVHDLSFSPREMLRAWIGEHCLATATGSRDVLKILVKDASIAARTQLGEYGRKEHVYNGQYLIEAQIERAGVSVASLKVTAHSQRSFDAETKISIKDEILREMVEEMLTNVTAEMTKDFHIYFDGYVKQVD